MDSGNDVKERNKQHAITITMSDRSYLAVEIACERINEAKTNFIRKRIIIDKKFIKKAEDELRIKSFEEIRKEYKKRKQYKRRKMKKGWTTTIYLPSIEYIAVLFASVDRKRTLTSYISKSLRIEKEYLVEADKMLDEDPNIILERKMRK
ncbi:hypothetical protein CN957_15985 [Bacillus cereus]|uniref:hypothetical protein n=1 Tax=Bacillus cereus group sp. BfR-BA-01441 TaxID=2920348 RepID=UPI000279F9D9|nr:hypothetical protein II9_05621 [Bacillus cereus MSX-D12]PGM79970.1 hypothetical protein CN957_15985 [Bacillus cereus]